MLEDSQALDPQIAASVGHRQAPVAFLVREEIHSRTMTPEEALTIVRGYDGRLWLPYPYPRKAPVRLGQVPLRTDGTAHLDVDGRLWVQTQEPHYVVDAYGIRVQWGGGRSEPGRLVFDHTRFSDAVWEATHMVASAGGDGDRLAARPHHYRAIELVNEVPLRDDDHR